MVFDGSWRKWGRKLQEGGNEPNFDSRLAGGIEATVNSSLVVRDLRHNRVYSAI